MLRRTLCIGLLLGLVACADMPMLAPGTGAEGFTSAQLTGAVKEALEISATRASESLGKTGGYSLSPEWRLTLPPAVQPLQQTLRQYGLGAPLDRVETLMNQGAEMAALEAKAMFIQAIRDMSVEDAWGILRGGDTAATDYFRARTEAQLRVRYDTLIKAQLQQLGFYNHYQQLQNSYRLLPIANKPNLDLETYAMNQGITALFTQIGREEQKLRANPREQGSLLLSRVLTAR